MKLAISIAVLVACGLAAGPPGTAQSLPSAPSKSKPSDQQRTPPNPPQPGSQSNPFPEDTTTVPLMPNGNSPVTPDGPSSSAAPSELPRADADPVRSPDDPMPDSSTASEGFSSSTTGMDRVLPPPDTDSSGGNNKNHAAPEHQESAAEDENVGSYYLDQKNWKAALSRFESAVVLDPENPEVYWGLGEAQRHLGKFTDARASYEKLVEYDPDSKHGKEARKLLKDPELANAPTAAKAKP